MILFNPRGEDFPQNTHTPNAFTTPPTKNSKRKGGSGAPGTPLTRSSPGAAVIRTDVAHTLVQNELKQRTYRVREKSKGKNVLVEKTRNARPRYFCVVCTEATHKNKANAPTKAQMRTTWYCKACAVPLHPGCTDKYPHDGSCKRHRTQYSGPGVKRVKEDPPDTMVDDETVSEED